MSIVHWMDLMTGLECEFFMEKGNQTENKINDWKTNENYKMSKNLC